MATTSAAVLRTSTEDDLERQLREAKEELFNLRFQAATGQLESHGRLRTVRRDIARIYTVLRERELGIIGFIEPAVATEDETPAETEVEAAADADSETTTAAEAEADKEPAEEPKAKQTTAKKSASKKATTKKPAAKKSTAKKSTAKKSAAKDDAETESTDEAAPADDGGAK
jgi:large subunit ribosomal protein L29